MLIGLVDRVTRRLRKGDRVARTVVLRMRFDDFSRATRSHTMRDPTSGTETILATARALFRGALPMIREKGLTLIGIAVSNLDEQDQVQLALPFVEDHELDLDVTVDDIRRRYGTKAITRGVLMGREPSWTVPLLPD